MGEEIKKRMEELQTMGVVLFTTEEAAKRLRVSPRTMERWRVKGGGPPYRKHGKRALYEEQTLMKWSAEGERRSTSEQL